MTRLWQRFGRRGTPDGAHERPELGTSAADPDPRGVEQPVRRRVQLRSAFRRGLREDRGDGQRAAHARLQDRAHQRLVRHHPRGPLDVPGGGQAVRRLPHRRPGQRREDPRAQGGEPACRSADGAAAHGHPSARRGPRHTQADQARQVGADQGGPPRRPRGDRGDLHQGRDPRARGGLLRPGRGSRPDGHGEHVGAAARRHPARDGQSGFPGVHGARHPAAKPAAQEAQPGRGGPAVDQADPALPPGRARRPRGILRAARRRRRGPAARRRLQGRVQEPGARTSGRCRRSGPPSSCGCCCRARRSG